MPHYTASDLDWFVGSISVCSIVVWSPTVCNLFAGSYRYAMFWPPPVSYLFAGVISVCFAIMHVYAVENLLYFANTFMN